MPGKAAKITITETQQDILRTFSRATTVPSRLRQRASIILMAFDGLLNQGIAAWVGLTHRQVGRWRRRWAKAWDRLIDIACCESRARLRRAIEEVLGDEPRPGAPAKFRPEQGTQILAVACEPPREVRPADHPLDGSGTDR
jgi:putative transposase